MSYVKIVLLVLQFVQYLVRKADEKRLISQGERNQIISALDNINKMVTEAHNVEASVAGSSTADVDNSLSEYYATDTGPGDSGDRWKPKFEPGAGSPPSRELLSDKPDDLGNKV